jgi:SAM-dependent methyltransferase
LDEYKKIMKLLGPEYAELNGGTVNILSLASGPGRDVIEVAEDLGRKGIAVRAACVDKCGESMELGKRLAEQKRLEGMTFRQCRIAEIREYAEAGSFDIVITQGILDYFSDDRAVDLLRSARALSKEGGTLVTSNMGRHVWIRFWMEFFGEWRLKYRNGRDLARLLLASGYDRRQIDVYRLPEGYHWMGLAKKGPRIAY